MPNKPLNPNRTQEGRPPLVVEGHPQFELIVKWFMEGRGPGFISKRVNPPIRMETLRLFKKNRYQAYIDKAKDVPIGIVQALAQKGLIKEGADGNQVAEVVAGATAKLAGTDKLMNRISRNYDIIDEQMEMIRSKSNQDKKPAVAAICTLVAADRSMIELDARINHIMDAPTTGVQVNIITPQSPLADIKSPIVQIGAPARDNG